MQMLGEVGLQILLFIWIFYILNKKMGIKVNKLAQATSLFIYSFLYFRYRIYPPLPFSVIAIYETNVLIGLFMWGGYLLVLVALSIAPLSVVAPVREVAVVAVAVWGVWKLHEREAAALKLSGAVATVVGVALVAL